MTAAVPNSVEGKRPSSIQFFLWNLLLIVALFTPLFAGIRRLGSEFSIPPLAIAAGALAVLGFKNRPREQISSTSRLEQIDRNWRSSVLLTWFLLSLYMYVWLCVRDRRLYLWEPSLAIFMWGGVLSLFLVAIPGRLAVNLLIPERRVKYRAESVALLVTFAALVWMFYAFLVYGPGSGPG